MYRAWLDTLPTGVISAISRHNLGLREYAALGTFHNYFEGLQ